MDSQKAAGVLQREGAEEDVGQPWGSISGTSFIHGVLLLDIVPLGSVMTWI